MEGVYRRRHCVHSAHSIVSLPLLNCRHTPFIQYLIDLDFYFSIDFATNSSESMGKKIFVIVNSMYINMVLNNVDISKIDLNLSICMQ